MTGAGGLLWLIRCPIQWGPSRLSVTPCHSNRQLSLLQDFASMPIKTLNSTIIIFQTNRAFLKVIVHGNICCVNGRHIFFAPSSLQPILSEYFKRLPCFLLHSWSTSSLFNFVFPSLHKWLVGALA